LAASAKFSASFSDSAFFASCFQFMSAYSASALVGAFAGVAFAFSAGRGVPQEKSSKRRTKEVKRMAICLELVLVYVESWKIAAQY